MFYQAQTAGFDPLAQQQSIANTDSGATRYTEAIASSSMDRNPINSLMRIGEDFFSNQGEQIAPDELNKKYSFGDFKIDRPMTDKLAESLYQRKKDELEKQDIIRRGGDGLFRQGLGLATGFATTFVDPLNIGLALVPALGEAKLATNLGFAMNTIRGRAAAAAISGGLQSALSEVPVWYQARQEYADYQLSDSLMNLAFGTGAGATIGALGGAFSKWHGTLDNEAKAALSRAAVAQMDEKGSVDLIELIDSSEPVILKEKQLGRKLTEEEKFNALIEDISSREAEKNLPNIFDRFSSLSKERKQFSFEDIFSNQSKIKIELKDIIENKKDVVPNFVDPTTKNFTGHKVSYEGTEGTLFRADDGTYLIRKSDGADLIVTKDPNASLRDLGVKFSKNNSEAIFKDGKVRMGAETFSLSENGWIIEDGQLKGVELVDGNGIKYFVESPSLVNQLRMDFLKEQLSNNKENVFKISQATSGLSKETDEIIDAIDLAKSEVGANPEFKKVALKTLSEEKINKALDELSATKVKLDLINKDVADSLSGIIDDLKLVKQLRNDQQDFYQILKLEAKEEAAKRLKKLSNDKINEHSQDLQAVELMVEKNNKPENQAKKMQENPSSTIDEDLAHYENLEKQMRESNRIFTESPEGKALLDEIDSSKSIAESQSRGVMAMAECFLKNIF